MVKQMPIHGCPCSHAREACYPTMIVAPSGVQRLIFRGSHKGEVLKWAQNALDTFEVVRDPARLACSLRFQTG